MKQVGGVPRKMRSDDGTENSIVEAIHTFLRSSHQDENAGLGTFSIGTSTSNQRIELGFLVTYKEIWIYLREFRSQVVRIK